MDISARGYILLLLIVGLLRLAEIRVSKRNQRRLAAKGVAKIPEPNFRWMVLFHIGILISAGVEVIAFRRPFIPVLALLMGLLFVAANSLRWWVIHVMSEYWNIQVMASAELGVVVDGPFRWIRHPNYVAVFTEMIALPLIHAAWFTALTGAVIHIEILSQRLRVEESVLLSNPRYMAAMGSKPRFLPKLFRTTAKSS
ncbi:MAG: hypothetical protein HY313_05140 [Acidobacteria bacterium]|nr:hypothetical protein [Acidobacteriota bacterium]